MDKVTVNGTNFMLSGKEYNFIGAYTFPTLTHIIYSKDVVYDNIPVEEAIDAYLDSLEQMNIEVIRFFGFGRYEINIYGSEEPAWERLDYLIQGCEQRGIRIIFVLWDYWDYGDSGPLQQKYEYWDYERVKPAITEIILRYKTSPAIFAWELMNEGDVDFIWDETGRTKVYNWIKEMSAYVKSIDSDTLLSTGFSGESLREGYFKRHPAYKEYSSIRSCIVSLYELPTLDFISFHIYGGNIDAMLDSSYYDNEWKREIKWFVNETKEISEEVGKPALHEL